MLHLDPTILAHGGVNLPSESEVYSLLRRRALEPEDDFGTLDAAVIAMVDQISCWPTAGVLTALLLRADQLRLDTSTSNPLSIVICGRDCKCISFGSFHDTTSSLVAVEKTVTVSLPREWCT